MAFAFECALELARLLKDILIDDCAFLASSFIDFYCKVSIFIESSDYSNFCLNIYSRLILLFMGVFLPPPSFRLSCGFVSPSPLDVSLIEQLYRICGMAGTML